MPAARLLVERYKKRHLAAQVRSVNGLRGIFKFSEILGSTSYSEYWCLLQVLRPHSLLTNLIIDYELVGTGAGGAIYHGSKPQRQQTCDDAFVYISDSASAAIVVYDVRNDAAWRVFHPSMLPHPDYSTYTVSINNTPTPTHHLPVPVGSKQMKLSLPTTNPPVSAPYTSII